MYNKDINIKNRVYNYHFANKSKQKKLETKNISVNEKSYKDLLVYLTTYVHSKSILILENELSDINFNINFELSMVFLKRH